MFYKQVFNGEVVALMRFKDGPGSDKLSHDEQNRIMHITLSIGEGTLIMGSDTPKAFSSSMVKGNTVSLAVGLESKEQAATIFDALASGGSTLMPIQDTFWGAYFGMLIDKYGTHWMVSYDYPTTAASFEEDAD